MTAYWVDYGMSFVSSQAQFRFPLALQIAFALATLAGMFVLPESPRWLMAHNRHDEAKEVLWSLLPDAKNASHDSPVIVQEMEEINHALKEEREAAAGGSFKAMLKNGPQKFFNRTMLGIGGQFMQQVMISALHEWN